MSIKSLRYPKYKDSGLKWLGEVPEHWDIYAIKRIVSLRSGETIDSEGIDEAGDFPVYGGNGLRGFTTEFTHNGEYALIGRQGALCGNVNYARGKFWASEHAIVATPIKPMETLWFGELLRTMNLNQYSVSAAQPGLSVEAIKNLPIPVPPQLEQRHIACFLGGQLKKIDVLVKEQRQLIELLKEKHQALISHAVTKGLNPNAPMRDSGIDWLGEVPGYWQLKRIKYVIRKLEQGWSPQCENLPAEEGEWGILKVGCVNGGSFDPDENKALPVDLSPIPSLGIRAGDLLISRANTRELIGSAAVAKSNYPRLMLCDKLFRLHLQAKACLPEYLAMFLRTPPARREIELSATGASSSMVNIGQSTITEMPMPLPPLGEQKAIADFISDEAVKTDQLVAGASHAIDLLEERRTALISAAVTGQIDVRNYRPQEDAATCQ